MGGRDTQITVYVTDERKAELKQRADEEDTSMSQYLTKHPRLAVSAA